jgi:hypothetical protein
MPKPRNEIKDLKQFGLVLAGILLMFGVVNCLKGRINIYPWFFGLSAITILLALTTPKYIKPIFIVFTKVGHAIGWVNSRIILSFIYFIFITPIAVIMRITGRDLLDRKIDKKEASYWVKHAATKSTKEKLEKQF